MRLGHLSAHLQSLCLLNAMLRHTLLLVLLLAAGARGVDVNTRGSALEVGFGEVDVRPAAQRACMGLC